MSEIPPTHVVAVPMSDVYTVGVAMPTGPVVTEVQWGIVGPPGEPGPAGLVWRGTWSPLTGYQATDAVAYAGPSGVVSSYVCLQDHTNQAPAEGADTAYWALLAQEGAQGPPGPPGSSMDVMDYLVSLTTTAPPGSGQLRLNNASQQAATWMWLDGFTAPGTDVKRILMLLHADALIDVQDKDDSTRHQQYRVTADPVDKGTYVEVPVVWVKGESPLVAQRALVALIREGSEGQQGPPGPGVAAGGATGQVLAKKSGSDYDTQWTVPPAMPVYDECGSLTEWTQHSGAGSMSVVTVGDSSVGGRVIRYVGHVTTTRTASLVPYDPNALYRIKFRVRQTADSTPAGNAAFYAGFTGIIADGVTPVNVLGNASHVVSQHYVAANGTQLTVAAGWQEFVGYVKGVAASGSYGTTTPSAPGRMHQDTRYIRPMFQINYIGNGTAEVDYVSLEVVPEPEQPLPVNDECGSLTPWQQHTGSGTVSVEQVADSSAGGKVINVAGWLGLARMPLVPYDPTALYRVKFRVRRTVNPGSGSNTVYAGLEGVAADGVTPVATNGGTTRGSAHAVAANGVALVQAGGWQEFVGYVKGVAAIGTSAVTTPSAPGVMHQNTRYIRPNVVINSGDAAGRAEIDYVSLEIIPATAASTEITFSGDGGTTPLSAALTGVTSGDWQIDAGHLKVFDGNVYIGVSTSQSQRLLSLQRLAANGTDIWRTDAVIGDNYTLLLSGQKNGVSQNQFIIWHDGTVSVRDVNNVWRPVPFATWTGAVAVAVNAAAVGTQAITFPAGRFTVAPTVVASTYGGSPAYYFSPNANAVSASGCNITLHYHTNTATTASVGVNVMAVQMTPTSAGGLMGMTQSEDEVVELVVTCHTEGCENADLSLRVWPPKENPTVICGPCGQFIDDRVDVTEPTP